MVKIFCFNYWSFVLAVFFCLLKKSEEACSSTVTTVFYSGTCSSIFSINSNFFFDTTLDGFTTEFKLIDNSAVFDAKDCCQKCYNVDSCFIYDFDNLLKICILYAFPLGSDFYQPSVAQNYYREKIGHVAGYWLK